MSTTNSLPHEAATDPRHVFLTASDIHARYRLARTAGYRLTRDPAFCRPCGPGRWRLDHLLAWEDAQHHDPTRPLAAAADPAADELPAPRRNTRRRPRPNDEAEAA
jgi:hypothetical protein